MSVDTVQTWLYAMHVEFDLNLETGTFRTEWVQDDMKFEVFIYCKPDGWIKIVATILKAESVPPQIKEALYAELLRENWRHEDVTYSMDEQGNLYAENDVPDYSNLGNFLTELNSVVYAVKQFNTNIAPIFGLANAMPLLPRE